MPMLWSRRLTPHVIALLCFFAFYLALVQHIRQWSYRDPGSLFFDPKRAFERQYSLVREEQAEAYMQRMSTPGSGYLKAGPNPSLCVGIATVQREGARYFRRTVGSVLAGLTDKEKRDIFLISFFANVDPKVHTAYNEQWTTLFSDQVLTYDGAPEDLRNRILQLEAPGVDPEFDRKPLLDYTALLRACYDHGAPYAVILEDDVVAAEGWYMRTKAALQALEHVPDYDKMIYLRLFYNERILGWNSEEWYIYLLVSLLIVGLVNILLSTVARRYPPTANALTPRTRSTITFILTPLCIGLYFAAGRLTVSPLPRGLHRMDKFGCCSQAFVFPRSRIPDLAGFLQAAGEGRITVPAGYSKVDVLTEYWAETNGLARWAITPSVFAHLGSTSSKSSSITQWGRSNTENIWNFSFELLDAEELKDEHL